MVKEGAVLLRVIVLTAPVDFGLLIKKATPPIPPTIIATRAIATMAVPIGIGSDVCGVSVGE